MKRSLLKPISYCSKLVFIYFLFLFLFAEVFPNRQWLGDAKTALQLYFEGQEEQLEVGKLLITLDNHCIEKSILWTLRQGKRNDKVYFRNNEPIVIQ